MLALGIILLVLCLLFLLVLIYRDYLKRPTQTNVAVDIDALVKAMPPEQQRVVEDRLAYYRAQREAAEADKGE